jgi:hypothetical protein
MSRVDWSTVALLRKALVEPCSPSRNRPSSIVTSAKDAGNPNRPRASDGEVNSTR